MGFPRRKKKSKYDVFISYRRLGGDQTALLIRESLLKRGYRVFFDVDTLRAGNFNAELLRVIDDCTDFIIVLPPNALDRCVNENDFLRIELEQAFKGNKNIIPILLSGFDFPDDMPDSIKEIRHRNGLKPVNDYFDAYINKLCEFLQSKPRKPIKGMVWLLAAAVVVICALAFAVFYRFTPVSSGVAAERQKSASALLYEEKLKFEGGDEAKAEYDVAYSYYSGAHQDWEVSLSYAESSADKGDPRAMLLAGLICYNQEKYEAAYGWFTKGAQNNHGKSLYMLGNMYYYGYYVDKDKHKAEDYYQKAADLGVEEAIEMVQKLKQK